MPDEKYTTIVATPPQPGGDVSAGRENLTGDERFRAVAERLLMDTKLKALPVAERFDPYTGEDMRQRSNEALCRQLAQRADEDLSEALGTTGDRFDQYTGEPIPQWLAVSVKPDGTTNEEISVDNLLARVELWRKIAGERVRVAEADGFHVSKFDAYTGDPIAPDSLRALEEMLLWRELQKEVKVTKQDVVSAQSAGGFGSTEDRRLAGNFYGVHQYDEFGRIRAGTIEERKN